MLHRRVSVGTGCELECARLPMRMKNSDTNLAVMTTTGSEIECDVVVTATGLKLVQSPGNIEISVDGTPMKLREHVTYRGAM